MSVLVTFTVGLVFWIVTSAATDLPSSSAGLASGMSFVLSSDASRPWSCFS